MLTSALRYADWSTGPGSPGSLHAVVWVSAWHPCRITGAGFVLATYIHTDSCPPILEIVLAEQGGFQVEKRVVVSPAVLHAMMLCTHWLRYTFQSLEARYPTLRTYALVSFCASQ